LAQANKLAAPSRRYGPDFYDYRMQSSRKVVVEELGENSISKFSIHSSKRKEKQEHESSGTPEDKDSAVDSEQPFSSDPIHWFGVLVNRPLKEAQTQFTSVVDISVPRVLNLAGQMRQLEIDIARARKAIKKVEKSVDSTILLATSSS
jgi:coiled-coil domain-containing protein 115